ncbi:MAG TPA: hypothetical protein VER17_04395 [Tepidisphaeraceae bacterium]|nr:hypothetical protein [Tepidisphaeraceae bacterium]
MKAHPRPSAAAAAAAVLTIALAGALVVSLAAGDAAAARVVRAGGGAGAAGAISMPHSVTDASGNQWMIYPTGWVQLQGNQPLFSQAGMFTINGSQPGMRNNQAKLDDKTGEVVFENMSIAGYQLTRRILVDKEGSYIRYVDILKNPKAQDESVNVQLASNLNFGIEAGQNIQDPRRKDNAIGFTTSNGNGRAIVDMYAGKGSKLLPNISYQQGNNTVQAQIQVAVPAGKEVAIVHLHGIVATPEQGVQFVEKFKEGKLLASLPAELRKAVVNFSAGQGFINDRELLRGDLFDVVEIRGGDQMRGSIKEQSFKLTTFYGDVELPASRVVGVINVGEFRPRQLIVTVDGEIFGGKLAKETLDLEMGTGQTTQIPLSQVTRAGYRKRDGEPEEWTFDKPFVSLRSGERVGVEMPADPIEVVTRYGVLKLDPKSIATVVFQSEEHGVHDIHLTDGSKFAGLVSAAQFEMKLSTGSSTTRPAGDGGGAAAAAGAGAASPAPQVVRFPASSVSRIQFAGPPAEAARDDAPTLTLMNNDTLVGGLVGAMKLDTAFDTLTIDAGQVRKLGRGKEGALDVQVTLWDASIVSGQLQEPTLTCQLESGVTVGIPVALVEEYNQPQPQPATGMIDKIKATVGQLNSDDWKVRDRAEAELTAMGPVVTGVLRQLRATQPPEAQQRIDQILASVGRKK